MTRRHALLSIVLLIPRRSRFRWSYSHPRHWECTMGGKKIGAIHRVSQEKWEATLAVQPFFQSAHESGSTARAWVETWGSES